MSEKAFKAIKEGLLDAIDLAKKETDLKELYDRAEHLGKVFEERDAEIKRIQEKNLSEAGKWIKVGEIGVDAGLCWIGDPCYVINLPHSLKDDPLETAKQKEDLGKTWAGRDGFCDRLYAKEKESGQPAAQFNYDAGHPGLGVCVQTGYGDGTYDVFIKKNKEGRVMEAKVIFIDENEIDEDE
jgi:hypothetical protein